MQKKGQHLPIVLLDEALTFPDVENATDEGLLAIGGDLSTERLLLAYRNGIFPWFNEDVLILWWSPDPRMVLFPKKIKISKSMKKVMGSGQFSLTVNTCFEEVVDNCAMIERNAQEGSWITPMMKSAYLELYELGYAKSYEVWQDGHLVGGLYGVDLDHVFCGESMFSAVSNASKFAFIHLAKDLEKQSYRLIDCQVYTKHLESLGAEKISRKDFIRILKAK